MGLSKQIQLAKLNHSINKAKKWPTKQEIIRCQKDELKRTPWTYEQYQEYLLSRQWKKKKEKRLEIDNYQCANCDKRTNLEVHHKHYRTLGNEDVYTDLVTLCDEHHKADYYVKIRRKLNLSQPNKT